MSVFKRKSRMLSLRLSEEEYQILHKASLANGARSVSDFARDSIFRVAQSASAPAADRLQARMDEFEIELHSIARNLQRLQRMAGPAPGVTE